MSSACFLVASSPFFFVSFVWGGVISDVLLETILVLHEVLGVPESILDVLGGGILGEDEILVFRRVLGILGRILKGDGVLEEILDILTPCVGEASLRVPVPDVLIDPVIGVHACNAFLLGGVLILVLDLLGGVLGGMFLRRATTLLTGVLTWGLLGIHDGILLGRIVGFLEMLRSRVPAYPLVGFRLLWAFEIIVLLCQLALRLLMSLRRHLPLPFCCFLIGPSRGRHVSRDRHVFVSPPLSLDSVAKS